MLRRCGTVQRRLSPKQMTQIPLENRETARQHQTMQLCLKPVGIIIPQTLPATGCRPETF
jgi:hypothetical protein